MMVLSKFPVPGHPSIWNTVGQGPTALAVGAGGGCLDVFTNPFSPLSPSLWETARYRLKYCFKGPLNPKQPTNHIHQMHSFVLLLQCAKRERSRWSCLGRLWKSVSESHLLAFHFRWLT